MDGAIDRAPRRATLLVAIVITLAALAVYHATFSAPFVFDDLPAIVENPTLGSFGQAWSPPPGGLPVSGRPLVNVTLALNHAISGQAVWSYHAFNLALHILAALTLFGLVRRTLRLRERNGAEASALLLAAAVGLVWVLHPLQTEAVTYVAQRAESLAALFYLLTLYAFVRATDSPRAGLWWAVSVGCCLLGMACKETMVTAPVAVLLFDAAWVTGGFRAAWKKHRGLYLSYAATWALLIWLVATTARRGGTAGFGLNITPWAYAQTQAEAIVRYVGLAFWPDPLVFDYGTYVAKDPAVVAICGLLVVLALAVTVWLWRLWPAAGFFGAVFFLLLAPSSSFVPVATQTMAEHRMYLPLAVLVVAVALGALRWLGRHAWAGLAVAAVALGGVTLARNADYRSPLALWSDTVAKRPDNFRARYNLALCQLDQGKPEAALAEVRTAVRLAPTNPDAHFNLALVLLRTGHADEAVTEAETSLRLRPGVADVHVALGNALMAANRLEEAMAQFSRALVLESGSFAAENNLAIAAARAGRTDVAVTHGTQAVKLRPDDADARRTLAEALRQAGRTDEALTEITTGVRLNAESPEAHYVMAAVLLQKGRSDAAQAEIAKALRLKPDYADAHGLLGSALLQAGRTDDGVAHYREALRLAPASVELHFNFANALLRLGQVNEAAGQYQEAIRLRPDFTKAHFNLGYLWLQADRPEEATKEFQAAVRLDPANLDARFNLANLQLQAGKLDAAETELREVILRQPTMPDAYNLLGVVLMTRGDARVAVPSFEMALRLKPDFPEARDNLLRARAAAGQGR